jgi:hypothetical protein
MRLRWVGRAGMLKPNKPAGGPALEFGHFRHTLVTQGHALSAQG